MRLSIPAALPVTAMLPALASPSRASTDATPEPKTSSAPKPVVPLTGFSLWIPPSARVWRSAARQLRLCTNLAANTIHWAPWRPLYATGEI